MKASTVTIKSQMRNMLVQLGYHSRPSFLIIGAQKCGTTSLYEMLATHPDIVPSLKKEVHYFDDGFIAYGAENKYHQYFPLPHRLIGGKLTYEASPSYLYNPDCPKRIHDYNSDMRLIILLREPISRAFSAWSMYRRFVGSENPIHAQLGETRSFEQAIEEEISKIPNVNWNTDKIAYVTRGIYADQIENYLQWFSQKNMLIIDQSELLNNPSQTMLHVGSFLGLDKSYEFPVIHANAVQNRKPIEQKIRRKLAEFYQPHNERLYKLIGQRFSW